MQNALFPSVTVGRVGRMLFSSISRPTVEQETKGSLMRCGLDTPRSARGYSTTGVILKQEGWLND